MTTINYEVRKSKFCGLCELIVGEIIYMGGKQHMNGDINKAYRRAEKYNIDKNCGCQAVVLEVKESKLNEISI